MQSSGTKDNILVIRFSSMGDVILLAPLLEVLKKRYPEAAVTVLTDPLFTGLFRDDPRISSVVGLKKGKEDDAGSIVARKWDLVIDLQNSRRSKRITKELKRGETGNCFDKLHIKRFFLLFFRLDFYASNDTVTNRYIRASGCTPGGDAEHKLFFESPLPAKVEEMLQSGSIVRPTIALFPFSAWKNKEWPREYYVDVGRYFLFKGWNVIIMGGPDEQCEAEGIRSEIGKKCISTAGMISLYECGCVLSRCTLALGNDTGLAHLARACGVKTGIIFGPTTRQFGFFPSGSPASRVFETRLCCRPCHAHGGNSCLRSDRACMRRISPEEVIRGLVELSESK